MHVFSSLIHTMSAVQISQTAGLHIHDKSNNILICINQYKLAVIGTAVSHTSTDALKNIAQSSRNDK